MHNLTQGPKSVDYDIQSCLPILVINKNTLHIRKYRKKEITLQCVAASLLCTFRAGQLKELHRDYYLIYGTNNECSDFVCTCYCLMQLQMLQLITLSITENAPESINCLSSKFCVFSQY